MGVHPEDAFAEKKANDLAKGRQGGAGCDRGLGPELANRFCGLEHLRRRPLKVKPSGHDPLSDGLIGLQRRLEKRPFKPRS